MDIRPERLLSRLVEGVVSANEFFELRLDGRNLLLGEVVLGDGDVGFLEVAKEADFVGLEEEEGFAVAGDATGGTADAVDVVAGVIWRVELDDPVDFGNLRRKVRI